MLKNTVLVDRNVYFDKSGDKVDAKKNNFIKKVMLGALIVRLVVLLLLYLLEPYLGINYMVPDVLHDDVKYVEGAEYYSTISNSIIDTEAFNIAMLSVGHNAKYSEENFWFWFVAIIIRMFKHEIVVRVLNIIFSIYTVKLVYKFAELFGNKKTAELSAKLYAYLPYPIIFCLFTFKDQLMSLCTMYFLYKLIKYRKGIKINKIEYFGLFLVLYIISQTRNGYAPVLIVMMLVVIMFNNIDRLRKIITARTIIMILIGTIFAIIFSNQLFDSIMSKLRVYLTRRGEYNQGMIAMVSINNILDFYKFPFTFPFAILQPLPSSVKVESWKDITALLNITMVPIAVGNLLNLFSLKNKEKLIYYCSLAIYGGTLMMSLGIFRHYYSLLPLAVTYYATYYFNTFRKSFLYIGSMFLATVWLTYIISI